MSIDHRIYSPLLLSNDKIRESYQFKQKARENQAVGGAKLKLELVMTDKSTEGMITRAKSKTRDLIE